MTRIAMIFCLALFGAGAAQAENLQASSSPGRLIAALEADGYVIEQTERTWLGRLRIVASKGELRREVVINPGTGEVLRDIASAADLEDSRATEGADGDAVASSRASQSDSGITAASEATLSAADPAATDENADGAASSAVEEASRDTLLPEAGVLQ